MKLNLAALALTVLSADGNLRGDRKLNQGFNKGLGRCDGAVCGMWGDPHMVTCDGLRYDCQGIGIFTLMDNHMFNVQGNFVDVGAHEHGLVAGWGLTHGASIANDVMIQFKENPEVPIIQLGFGDLTGYEPDQIPSEEGCSEWTTFTPVDMGGDGKRTCVPNLEACRARCDAHPTCTQFSWWADCGCHLNNDDAVSKPSNRSWPRALAGVTGSDCGTPKEQDIELSGENGENDKFGIIRNQCPLLMYIGGELIDLSGITPGPSNGVQALYNTPDDDYFIEIINNRDVRVVLKLEDGNYAEMELKQNGDGPGEMWSCHWDFKMCLPASQQSEFTAEGATKGLLGTPNGNTQDDWMDITGKTLSLQHTGHNRHENMINYCVENWCVSEGDSLMTYHGEGSYADYKCENEDHVDWENDNELCVLSADQILFYCKDKPILTKYACQMDCCYGNNECGKNDEFISDDLETNGPPPKDDVVFEYEADCEEVNIVDTGSTVCPDADIVTLLKTNGDEPLPEDTDIFYDITFGEGTVKFKVNNPFDANAEVFVKHDKTAIQGFVDPTCDADSLSQSGCKDDFSIEVACLDYDDIEPFALVSVYFASVAVSPLNEQATIDRCCEPEEFAPAVGIVEYTFEIKCGCPGPIPQ